MPTASLLLLALRTHSSAAHPRTCFWCQCQLPSHVDVYPEHGLGRGEKRNTGSGVGGVRVWGFAHQDQGSIHRSRNPAMNPTLVHSSRIRLTTQHTLRDVTALQDTLRDVTALQDTLRDVTSLQDTLRDVTAHVTRPSPHGMKRQSTSSAYTASLPPRGRRQSQAGSTRARWPPS